MADSVIKKAFDYAPYDWRVPECEAYASLIYCGDSVWELSISVKGERDEHVIQNTVKFASEPLWPRTEQIRRFAREIGDSLVEYIEKTSK